MTKQPETLLDLLGELAEMLPERIRYEADSQCYRVKVLHSWERAIVRDGQLNAWGELMTERALREECVARRWPVGVCTLHDGGEVDWGAWAGWDGEYDAYRNRAPSPAFALALAMCSAVRKRPQE